MEENRILEELNIKDEVLNIYPYGSFVYGNNTEDSDRDFVIVTKSAFLSDGSFKRNAISNSDFTMQGILYSRTGFIDAINNYDITALECMFLPPDKVVKNKWHFKLNAINTKALAKSLVSKASMSVHSAKRFRKDGDEYMAKKGMYHAIRILIFGNQIKDHGRIVDYSATNSIKEEIMNDNNFSTRKYDAVIEELTKKLRA